MPEKRGFSVQSQSTREKATNALHSLFTPAEALEFSTPGGEKRHGSCFNWRRRGAGFKRSSRN
jgi:hypothetical protein